MGTWEEEWLDMTKDKQGMMASSPQKIESWQQEFLDMTAGKSTVNPIPPTSNLRTDSVFSVRTPVKIATPQYVNFQNDINYLLKLINLLLQFKLK